MSDPIDSFKLPSELCALLSSSDQEAVMATIIDIDIRLFERDPELEQVRGHGGHLWLLFDAIAAPLQDSPSFKELLVPDFIPRMIEQIRKDLSWYPHNMGDLKPYYLAAPIRRWRHAIKKTQASGRGSILSQATSGYLTNDDALSESAHMPRGLEAQRPAEIPKVKKPVRRSEKYERIDKALREIAEARPTKHEEVFQALDERKVPRPKRKPFRAAGGWLKGFQQNRHAASAWLSQNWGRLGLPAFPRGPQK